MRNITMTMNAVSCVARHVRARPAFSSQTSSPGSRGQVCPSSPRLASVASLTVVSRIRPVRRRRGPHRHLQDI